MKFRNSRSLLAILSVAVPFFIYLSNLAPSVVFFDAGELIVSSYLISPGHPPGYPLYVTLGKFASFLPFGSIAYKLNTMAAFFSALSTLMVYLITSRVLDELRTPDEMRRYKELISFITALTFGFSYDFWNQAVIAEVYPMNTFIAGVIIYILLLWRDEIKDRQSHSDYTPQKPESAEPTQPARSYDSRLLYLVSFLLGLGLGNHHTQLVIIPVLFLVVAATNWRQLFDARTWGITVTLFLLGISVYILLPIRASHTLELNWGDPDTFSKFKWVFFREGYPRQGLYRPWGLFWKQLNTFDILYGFSLVGFSIGCLGILAYLRKLWLEVLVTLTVILVLSVGVTIYGNPIEENIFLIESFHVPSYMIFSIWIGIGMFFILTQVKKLAENTAISGQIGTIFVVVALILPASLCMGYYPWNDRSHDSIAYDYAQNELASMPSNAILFTWGDSGAFPLWYVQIVERYQPGVLLVHTPHLSTKWYVDELPDTVRMGQLQWIQRDDLYAEAAFMIMLRENFEKYPLFIDYSTRYSVPVEGYVSIPHGLIYELGTDSMKMTDTSIWGKYIMRQIYKKDPYRDLDTGKAVTIYANTIFDGGTHLLRLGYSDEAYAQFGEAVKINPSFKAQVREIMFGGQVMPEGHP